jgi:prepilin-type processing-associated H-X9-DG protein
MREIELKFQVPRDQRAAIDKAVSGAHAANRMRLQAAYFDTPSGALAGAGLALRLRKEGRRWVQTLKGGLPDATGMTRAEHNVDVRASGASVPPIDPARHPFTECDGPATLVMCHSGPAPGEPGVVHPPSFPTCHVCQMYAPWGGGQVLFGDGHVQFIPTRIDLNTWAALCSMAAGDVPGEH